jgi:hypothetical protein
MSILYSFLGLWLLSFIWIFIVKIDEPEKIKVKYPAFSIEKSWAILLLADVFASTFLAIFFSFILLGFHLLWLGLFG